ncbi:AraC family transcriptional regulator [Pseudoxanthomonas indica]|uniref:Transcriptional regulator, AraC family n=1 Tax=Pseudoxanthomonas indica TaxID=428993 RepID=A0A1T5KBS3_9GAMM|nr:helix-turn-helix domain-containing protein [Pseudoxanthomonas indica]GGD48295.1 AraC family transcriptional regulator [Pseudoxanthomonas indica]SKC61127.1 transcriptional regulator, AraC family [Pseudoxanthomonas indica]
MTRDPGPARGVLHADPSAGAFEHARIAPAPELDAIVAHYWRVRWQLRGGLEQTRQTLPHPNVHLVITNGVATVSGVHTARFTTTLRGDGEVFGIKFRAGGVRATLGMPVSKLRDRTLPAREVLGAWVDELVAVLARSHEDAERIAAINAVLLANTRAPSQAGQRAGIILDAIAGDDTLLRVDDVLSRWPMQRRTLERLFDDEVGVSPKWVIQRYRLHEALARMTREAPVDWAQFAQDLGYFDQAHFIRDFRSQVGMTPSAYHRRLQRTD